MTGQLVYYAMQVDAVLLIAVMACCIIVAQEDTGISCVSRWLALAVGAGAFMMAMWLLGIWTPSPAGYPIPRLVFDLGITMASINRAREVLATKARVARRLKHQQQQSPFTVVRNQKGRAS